MAKGEVLPAETTSDVVLYDRGMFPELLSQDPQEVQARFTRRFQQARDLDDLFDVLEGTNSKMLVGQKLEVTDAQWAPYETEEGVVPLAIATATDLDSGEVIEFATTSAMMCLFIRQAQILQAMPFKAKVVSKKTRSGRQALNFARL